MGAVTECIIAEEISYGCSGIATALSANNLGVRDFRPLTFNLIIYLLELILYLKF